MEKTENKRNKRISNFYMIMYFAIFGCSYFAVCVFENMKITVLSTILVLVGVSGYLLFEPLLLRRFNRKSGTAHLLINGFLGTSILVFVNAFSVISRDKSVFIFLISFGVFVAVFTFLAF